MEEMMQPTFYRKGIVGFIASAAPIAASKSGMLHSILEIAALGLGVAVSFLYSCITSVYG